MLFMVIERFRNKDPKPIGERFKRQGRMMPEGVVYHASWIDPAAARCFQIMEADSVEPVHGREVVNVSRLEDGDVLVALDVGGHGLIARRVRAKAVLRADEQEVTSGRDDRPVRDRRPRREGDERVRPRQLDEHRLRMLRAGPGAEDAGADRQGRTDDGNGVRA